MWIGGALFIAKVYGVNLGAREILLIGAVSVVLELHWAGIPSGSLLLMAPVFSNLGLPIEGIGILIALDVVPDIFKTDFERDGGHGGGHHSRACRPRAGTDSALFSGGADSSETSATAVPQASSR